MNETVLEYPYRANPVTMLAGMAFFGACAAAGVGFAVTNDRGLVLNGIIRFSVGGATIFYWCLAAVSMIFVLVAILALVMNFTTPRFVRLTSTELSVPPYGFARKSTVIALSDITQITTQTVQRQEFLNIHHQRGKSTVSKSMLPRSDAFERLKAALVESTLSKKR